MFWPKRYKAHNARIRADGTVYVNLRVRHLYGVDYEDWTRAVGGEWRNKDYVPLNRGRRRALEKAERWLRKQRP